MLMVLFGLTVNWKEDIRILLSHTVYNIITTVSNPEDHSGCDRFDLDLYLSASTMTNGVITILVLNTTSCDKVCL